MPRTSCGCCAEWVERRGAPITIRLVKGAYWDYEVVDRAAAGLARAGLPPEVAERRVASSGAPGSCCEHHEPAAPGLRQPQCPQPGARDRRRRGAGTAADLPTSSRPSSAWATSIQRALVDRGHRVRVYTPYGAILPGMAYLVRRLLENTSNESFLKASFAETAPDRRPAARPRGDRSHVDANATPQDRSSAVRWRLGRAAAVSQRAADRLRPRREPRGDAPGARAKSAASSAGRIRS